MQARLRSDRIHAAAVASIPVYEALVAEKEKLMQDEEDHRTQIVMKQKTMFGRAKHNEVTARQRAWTVRGNGGWHSDYQRWVWQAKEKLARVQRIIEKTAITTKPFPILLDEKDYNLIWEKL